MTTDARFKLERRGEVPEVDPDKTDFYRATLELFNAEELPFLVGGTHAYYRYTGIARETKDFDVFIRARDYPRLEAAVQKRGLRDGAQVPALAGQDLQGRRVHRPHLLRRQRRGRGRRRMVRALRRREDLRRARAARRARGDDLVEVVRHGARALRRRRRDAPPPPHRQAPRLEPPPAPLRRSLAAAPDADREVRLRLPERAIPHPARSDRGAARALQCGAERALASDAR